MRPEKSKGNRPGLQLNAQRGDSRIPQGSQWGLSLSFQSRSPTDWGLPGDRTELMLFWVSVLPGTGPVWWGRQSWIAF